MAPVNIDVTLGSELIDIPERANLKVSVAPMRDPFIRELRRIFGKTRSVEGMRLAGQMIGDRFLPDAYVYRICNWRPCHP